MKSENQRPTGFDFFISFAHATMSGYATDIADELRYRGYTSFLSIWCMDLKTQGEPARLELSVALKECNSLIVIVDPAATFSDWIPWEIDEFLRATTSSHKLFVIYFDGRGDEEHVDNARQQKTLRELAELKRKYQRDVTHSYLVKLRNEPRAVLLRESGDPMGIPHGPSVHIVRLIIRCHGHAPKSGGPVGYDLKDEIDAIVDDGKRCRGGCVCLLICLLILLIVVVAYFVARVLF